MRVEVVPSFPGRYVWRLWEDGRMIARGAASTEERAQLAAAVGEARWNHHQERHVYGELSEQRKETAPEELPAWLLPGGDGA